MRTIQEYKRKRKSKQERKFKAAEDQGIWGNFKTENQKQDGSGFCRRANVLSTGRSQKESASSEKTERENAKMQKCENAKIRKCENAIMRCTERNKAAKDRAQSYFL